ncbi:hypothetical protein SOVF_117750 [Spinacia oleracea]|nr:hypothetical protein SOVF_117750 [Spinacia oleracea]
MAEAIILPMAKLILGKIASGPSDLVYTYVTEEIKGAKSAKKDLKIIADKMEAICAVLEDEEEEFSNKANKIWLRDLKSIVYDIDDLLDEVAFDALQRRVNQGYFGRQLRYYLSSSNPLISRFDLSHKIESLRKKLEIIVAKKNEFDLTKRPVKASKVEIRDPFDECDYVYEPAIIGRNEAKQDIISKLTALGDASELSVFSIVGMGGIGKTALAKLVHHDVPNFDLKLWVCVSDKFHIPKIIEDILKAGTGDNTPNQDMSMLVKKLGNLLNGKKYFLVLDDVWVEEIDEWRKLKNLLAVGKSGSSILTTTRLANVALMAETMESYNLDCLSDHVCWSIFKQLAFKEGEDGRYPNLHAIGWCIVKKCRGIPLVVKCLGNLLRKLTSLPNSIKYLQKLQIKNCEELDFDKGEGLEGLQSLRLLYISNLKLTRLPNDIQSAAASLQHLSVENCLGLVELPYWLHRFASLRTIEIIYCRNLLSLPKTISHLISLQELKIKGCPHLSKRCGVPGGEDYSLVQHVPKFELDEVCFLTK